MTMENYGPPEIVWPRLSYSLGGRLEQVVHTTCPGRNTLSKLTQMLSGGVKVKDNIYFDFVEVRKGTCSRDRFLVPKNCFDL